MNFGYSSIDNIYKDIVYKGIVKSLTIYFKLGSSNSVSWLQN